MLVHYSLWLARRFDTRRQTVGMFVAALQDGILQKNEHLVNPGPRESLISNLRTLNFLLKMWTLIAHCDWSDLAPHGKLSTCHKIRDFKKRACGWSRPAWVIYIQSSHFEFRSFIVIGPHIWRQTANCRRVRCCFARCQTSKSEPHARGATSCGTAS